MRLALLGAVLPLAVGCSGGSAGSPVVIDSVAAPVEVPAGVEMTIAPGADLAAASGATLTVRGRLTLPTGSGPHARIRPASAGQPWAGIVVEAGGVLDVHGLDLDGADTAIDVKAGGQASYVDGTISDPLNPFNVARGGGLEVTRAKVVGAESSSGVSGTFKASYLDYENAGFNGGIIMNDANATFDVEDSTFRGAVGAGGDYIVSYGAKLVRIAYSTITGSHCAFHFNGVDRFEIDHVTAGDLLPTGAGDLNAWGAMLYGSGAGPNVIRGSNFMNSTMNLDQVGANGPLTITNTYTTGKNMQDTGWTWLAADVAASPILDAKPR